MKEEAKEKIYSDKDLDSIINFLKQGYELSKAKILSLQEDPLIHLISNSVMDYFNIKTLIPRSRKSEDIIPMVVFFYLVVDQSKNPKNSIYFTKALQLTKKHRTTYLHYLRNYVSGLHMMDSRILNGKSLTNHFLEIKEKITGEDLTNIKVEDKVIISKAKQAKTKFDKKIDENIEEMMDDISSGFSYSDLNNKYFQYNDCSSFKYRLKKSHSNMYSMVKRHRSSLASKVYKEDKETIDKIIEGGVTWSALNNMFFEYLDVYSLKVAVMKLSPELYGEISLSQEKRKEQKYAR